MDQDYIEKRIEIDKNMKTQKELLEIAFKREARREALKIASGNKPSYYPSQGLGQGLQQQPNYDLIGEAEKIYQWLIKNEVV